MSSQYYSKPIPLAGVATYSANGNWTVNGSTLSAVVNQQAQQLGFSARPILKKLVFVISANLINSAVGAVSVTKGKIEELISTFTISTPEIQDWDQVTQQAGKVLSANHLARVKREPVTLTTVSATGSATTNKVAVFERSFVDERFGSELCEDFCPLISEFEGGQIQGTWPNAAAGGVFGADVTLDATTTITVYAVFGFRVKNLISARQRLKTIQPSAVDTTVSGLSGCMILDAAMLTLNANNTPTGATLTAANVGTLTTKIAGRDIQFLTPATAVIQSFNDDPGVQATLSDTAIANVPFVAPDPIKARITQLPFQVGDFAWKQTGTTTTAQGTYYFGVSYLSGMTADFAAAIARRLGIPGKAVVSLGKKNSRVSEAAKAFLPYEIVAA